MATCCALSSMRWRSSRSSMSSKLSGKCTGSPTAPSMSVLHLQLFKRLQCTQIAGDLFQIAARCPHEVALCDVVAAELCIGSTVGRTAKQPLALALVVEFAVDPRNQRLLGDRLGELLCFGHADAASSTTHDSGVYCSSRN